MNSRRGRRLTLAALICSALNNAHAASFIYEGRLDDLGQPANGRYDLQLSAYDDAAHGGMLTAQRRSGVCATVSHRFGNGCIAHSDSALQTD